MNEDNTSIRACLNEIKLDVREMRVLGEERTADIKELKREFEIMEAELEKVKSFMWKIGGGILVIAVLIESIVLWMTRAPIH